VNADEIMHVLRLTAMGRLNTPAQEEFCEKLAKALAEPDPTKVVLERMWIGPEGDAQPVDPDAEVRLSDLVTTVAVSAERCNQINAALGLPTLKRTRKTKAE
jgi:hypothetical protein